MATLGGSVLTALELAKRLGPDGMVNKAVNVLAQDNTPCAATNYLIQPFGADGTAPPDVGAMMMMDATTGEIYSIVGDVRAVESGRGNRKARNAAIVA